ncbi:MAG: hypothetical protein V1845_00895 [bacterium]
MSLFSNLTQNLDLGSNWLLILVFLGAGLAYGLVLGRNKLNLITLAGYLSFAISKFIPWKTFLGNDSTPDSNVQIFIFLGIILAIFFFGPRSGFSSAVKTGGRGRAAFWQLGIMGILQIGFLVSAVISFLPVKTLADLSLAVRQILQIFYDPSNPLAQFLWLLLPLAAMFGLKARRSYNYSDDD